MMSKVGICGMALEVTHRRINLNIGATVKATKGKHIGSRRGGDTMGGPVKIREVVMVLVLANRTGRGSNAICLGRRFDA
jgi:hypothetical protein